MQNYKKVLIALMLCCSIAGCRHSVSPATPVHVLPVAVRAAQPVTPEAAANHINPAVAAELQVRSDPLFHQAEIACKHKQFTHAANLLTQLSHNPRLSADQITFCQTQIDICRKDAGLPAVNTKRPIPGAAQTPPQANTAKRTPVDADCGPRALMLVCEKLGVKTDVASLRKTANTTADGTTLEGLETAAKSLGLETEGIQTGRDALPGLKLPAIAWWQGNHYVAVLACEGKGDAATVTIQDPNKEHEETIPEEAFLRRSSGYLLLIHRK